MGLFEIIAFIRNLGNLAPEIISALAAGVSAAIVVALAIPGDQPEKFLQKLLDILKRFSKK